MKPQIGGTVTPWLLKSLTNTSPTTWVLTLNSGIKFQDGAPLDAAALVACLQYQAAQNSSVPAALPGVKLAATGPDEVTLTTSAPVPDVPFILGDEVAETHDGGGARRRGGQLKGGVHPAAEAVAIELGRPGVAEHEAAVAERLDRRGLQHSAGS